MLANWLKSHNWDDDEHLDDNFSKTFFPEEPLSPRQCIRNFNPVSPRTVPSDLDNNSFQQNLLKLLDLDDDAQLDDNFGKTF